MTRANTSAPAADLGGTYEGTYSESDNFASFCLNFSRLNFSGPASLTIAHANNAVSGWLTFHEVLDVITDGRGNCVPVEIGDVVLPVYGTLDGNTVTLILPLGGATSALKCGAAGLGGAQNTKGRLPPQALTSQCPGW